MFRKTYMAVQDKQLARFGLPTEVLIFILSPGMLTSLTRPTPQRVRVLKHERNYQQRNKCTVYMQPCQELLQKMAVLSVSSKQEFLFSCMRGTQMMILYAKKFIVGRINVSDCKLYVQLCLYINV